MANLLTELSDGVRRLQRLTKDVSELELKEEILSLRHLLLDIKQELMDKDDRIRQLEASLDKQANTVEIEGFKFDLIQGEPVGLPYCPTCDVREGKLFRLSKRNALYSLCANCKTLHNAGADGLVNGKEEAVDYNARFRDLGGKLSGF